MKDSAGEMKFVTRAGELRRLRSLRQRLRATARGAVIGAIYPIVRTLGALGGSRDALRVVLYHHVFDDQVEDFRRHLDYLAGSFEFVDLERFLRCLRGEEKCGGRKLLVTFDDGFKDNATNAAGVLDAFGVRAAFFVATDFVSLGPADRERYLHYASEVFHTGQPVENMTWDDLRGILDRGHRVGSHTMTHRRLTALSATELERELAGSRQELEGRLGGRCADLSFPYGRAGDRRADLKDLSRRAGYRSCFSAIRGGNHPGDDPYEIRRDALDPSWPLMQVKFFLSQR